MHTKANPWRLTLVLVLVLLMAMPSVAVAKKKPPSGGELTNNLSVPAVFVKASGETIPFTVTCDASLLDPSGTPLTGYEIDTNYYYVQGIHTWQAQCATADPNTITATLDWGDNLEGGEALKAGSPIRVEVGLTTTPQAAMTGYIVSKLEPSKLDRESAYGTLAVGSPETGFTGVRTNFSVVRVWDSQATFSIHNDTTGEWVVPANTPMSAEINSGGAVVYGYNWGIGGHGVKALPTAGTYTITFDAPQVGVHESLTVTISPRNRGGGGGRGNDAASQ